MAYEEERAELELEVGEGERAWEEAEQLASEVAHVNARAVVAEQKEQAAEQEQSGAELERLRLKFGAKTGTASTWKILAAESLAPSPSAPAAANPEGILVESRGSASSLGPEANKLFFQPGGAFTVTLRWQQNCDLDLHLIAPSGERISCAPQQKPSSRTPRAGTEPLADSRADQKKKSSCGGELDVDRQSCSAADIEEKGGAVENIFYMSDAPQGRFVGWVVDYTGGDGAAYTVTVLGGGEKVYSKGGEPVPQIKSFTNYLMTAASSEVPAGNWSKGKPGQKVFEFEWTSRAEPIKWIEERPPPPPGGPKLK